MRDDGDDANDGAGSDSAVREGQGGLGIVLLVDEDVCKVFLNAFVGFLK